MYSFNLFSSRSSFFFVVIMVAVADSSPAKELFYSVKEEAPPGTFVGNVASDLESSLGGAGADRRFRFKLLSSSSDSSSRRDFVVVETSGVVTTARPIDREAACLGAAECFAALDVLISSAEGAKGFFRVVKIRVDVLDVNDHAPSFPGDAFLHVPENAPLRSRIPFQAAEDPDFGVNGVQQYELADPNDRFAVSVVKSEGSDVVQPVLVILRPLDRERQASYLLRVVAKDRGVPQRSGSVVVNVTVTDANDHHPSFDRVKYEEYLREDVAVGTSVMTVTATDRDIGSNAKIVYSLHPLSPPSALETFAVNEATGEIVLRNGLDYEKQTEHVLTLVAKDGGEEPATATAQVVVHVLDANDNSPEISVSFADGEDGVAFVSEWAPYGTFVAYVRVTDPDAGNNGNVRCSVGDETAFSLSPNHDKEWSLLTATRLDRERRDQYRVVIKAWDAGTPSRMATFEVIVKVLDENDFAPKFVQLNYRTRIQENFVDPKAPIRLAQVSAKDEDLGPNAMVRYSIPRAFESLFQVNSTTGVLTTTAKFDREISPEIHLPIVASDCGKPAKSSTATVDIFVLDVNDNAPAFPTDHFSFRVAERRPPGVVVDSVAARDPDDGENGAVTYSLLDDAEDNAASGVFVVDRETGAIKTTKTLDREERALYRVVVAATDGGYPRLTGTVQVTVHVGDVNDNPPVVTYPNDEDNVVYAAASSRRGQLVAKVRATDADAGPNAALKYSMTNARPDSLFDVTKSSGELYFKRSASAEELGTHRIQVAVSDGGIPRNTVTARFNVVVSDVETETGAGEIAVHIVNKTYTAGFYKSQEQSMSQTTASVLVVVGVLALILLLGAIAVVIACERAKKNNHAYNVRKEARRLFRSKAVCMRGSPSKDLEDGRSESLEREGASERRSRRCSLGSVESGGSWDSYGTGRTGRSVASPVAMNLKMETTSLRTFPRSASYHHRSQESGEKKTGVDAVAARRLASKSEADFLDERSFTLPGKALNLDHSQVVKLVEALKKDSLNEAKPDPTKAYDEMLDPDKVDIKQNNQENGATGGIFSDSHHVSAFSQCKETNVNLASNNIANSTKILQSDYFDPSASSEQHSQLPLPPQLPSPIDRSTILTHLPRGLPSPPPLPKLPPKPPGISSQNYVTLRRILQEIQANPASIPNQRYHLEIPSSAKSPTPKPKFATVGRSRSLRLSPPSMERSVENSYFHSLSGRREASTRQGDGWNARFPGQARACRRSFREAVATQSRTAPTTPLSEDEAPVTERSALFGARTAEMRARGGLALENRAEPLQRRRRGAVYRSRSQSPHNFLETNNSKFRRLVSEKYPDQEESCVRFLGIEGDSCSTGETGESDDGLNEGNILLRQYNRTKKAVTDDDAETGESSESSTNSLRNASSSDEDDTLETSRSSAEARDEEFVLDTYSNCNKTPCANPSSKIVNNRNASFKSSNVNGSLRRYQTTSIRHVPSLAVSIDQNKKQRGAVSFTKLSSGSTNAKPVSIV